MGVVILNGFIIVPSNDLALVKDELDNHIQLTRSETGCLIFKVTQDPLNPCRFDVYEEFVDEAAFQAHQARVKSSRWGKITVNVERHYTVTGIA
ncbi:putative quinol monooxygenase [Aeromonas veronii]|uniref:putative quinol monooxygenase n=1 Tax=Aeromonas veronii TaxID=654 RepID=UPI00188253C2|nr:antibiotic biosynthesis monooxygenase [Aeromonas veronii]MBE8733757.1 antibiotic biosynthesis monooxygenase [Aeromonas veronii]MBE8740741.1 antibiotic biosynthesis monooxygenase [Aeromonas veronii]MBE8742508.1 antibiotic biosynthesis monooxygenase [Aeromonas veronii]MBE8766118.1 antibiotic biosynthesis monooxygenase [Aeromonas veronii]MBE8841301.1 antibiotic biosynthesis monooxygenase [Aeromonas veronii]